MRNFLKVLIDSFFFLKFKYSIPNESDSDSSDSEDELTQMTQAGSQSGLVEDVEKKFRFRRGDDIINLLGEGENFFFRS